ncbi:MAG: hypothetical protein QOI80_2333 [Solirubrobacteraceae bacterium]|nr:hypothetical protein [Solirubrobacteraceae bacterium]
MADPLSDPILKIVTNLAGGSAPVHSDAIARMAEAEDTLRAIGAGEVDAFVLTDGASVRRVFTLSTADRPYRNFVEKMSDGAATLSSEGLILYANRRLAELVSRPREELVGLPLAGFVVGGLPAGFLESDGAGQSHEWALVYAGGPPVHVLVGTSRLETDGDDLFCLTFSDLTALRAQSREIAMLSELQAVQMTELKNAQAELVERATHDDLTHLPNRALLVDRIDQALSQAARSGHYTVVLFVDVDRFKQVNDTRGHAAGDSVLRDVAADLLDVLRPMDTVARIGGDEFIVLAPDMSSSLDAVGLAERLVAGVGRSSNGGDDAEAVTVSVGIAVSENGRGPAEVLLSEADAAMYKAKSLGGGRAEIFDQELRDQVQVRAKGEQMLHAALDDGRVVAHYQPLVDLAGGKVTGFEALARIAQTDGTLLPPAAFISIAEDSGLVVELGGQMLASACHEARGWQTSGASRRPLSVAVNLSARQFEAGDLTTIVRDQLDQAGLAPSCLHLELTETALLGLHSGILEQLTALRDMGVEIGLDDFGTGYASLTHLRRLPATFVKIDQTFVRGLVTDPEDERIVEAVIQLAANLGLRSIAEGVETEAELTRLRELGCDQAQGYLFARPLPHSDIPAAIAHTPW